MKKTLLVAALAAGFAGVAHAESSVTLYGVVDAGYGYKAEKITNGDVTIKTRTLGAQSGVQNGSRWGLKGSEDLGNGTSAIFQLESGFSVGDGTSKQGGRLFGRTALVGLTGDSWGTFTIGRQANAGDAFVSGFDPFQTGWNQASSNNTFGDVVFRRYDSVIKYVSPDFSGFQFGVGLVHSDKKITKNGNYIYKVDEKTGKTLYDQPLSGGKTTGVTFGFGYNNGPLSFGASADIAKVKTYGLLVPQSKTMTSWALGASYDFDVVKVYAMYGQQHNGQFGEDSGSYFDSVSDMKVIFDNGKEAYLGNVIQGDGLRNQAWLVGLSAPVGEAGKVLFSYQGGVLKNKDVDNLKFKTHAFSLGYRHALSKRTSVYALASYAKGKVKGFTNGSVKYKSTEVVLGLTHKF
ncbi:porin [Pelistega europaea]|uniref:Porin n=1 Tax=Pelistega europaea TaxID=106147 RepID=A0A7Y4P589_9BURK|nr:porin [Pelistega europaea]NOL50266.1 porin [Pelistega europaea]